MSELRGGGNNIFFSPPLKMKDCNMKKYLYTFTDQLLQVLSLSYHIAQLAGGGENKTRLTSNRYTLQKIPTTGIVVLVSYCCFSFLTALSII